MKTISFINLKGGVGKTTIVTNVAFALANFWGARVLVIDNDKQGNASLFFSSGGPPKATLTDLLLDGAGVQDCIQATRYNPEWFITRRRNQRQKVHFHDARIDLIGADMGLMDANLSILADSDKRQDDILRNALAKINAMYDICLIDNPPDINISVLNALTASDEVIIISTPDAYSVQGIYEMANLIKNEVSHFNPKLCFSGILFNKCAKTQSSTSYMREIEQKYPVFPQKIRLTRDKTDESTRLRQSIYEFSPQCGFAIDLGNFLEYYMEGQTK